MSQRTNDLEAAAVVLTEKNGRFFFFQPDIGVIASDDKVEGAYGKFLEARRAFLNEVAQAGLALEGRASTTGAARAVPGMVAIASPGRRAIATELGLFVVKLCIVLVVVGGMGAVIGSRVAGGIASSLEQVKMPKQVSFDDVLHKAADIARDIQSLTKEEKAALVQSVGTISRELDPIVDAWRNPPAR